MKKLFLIFLFLILTKLISFGQIVDPKIEETSNKSRAKVIVYTKTGEIYKGFFISQNKDFLEIQIENAGTIRLPTQRIKSIESIEEGDSWATADDEIISQVNPVRYLLGTSAFNYEKGRNYIRNNPMTFHRGVTDNFSFGVGTSLWALVLRVPIIYVNPQYTSQLGKNVRFKVGLDAFAAAALEEGGGAAAALLNTGLTLGDPDLNLTGTVYFAALSDFDNRLNPFYSLAGMARISEKLMVVSEGFYIPTEFGENFSFFVYGGRYVADSATYDLGFLYNQQIADFLPFGVPFFAITVKL